MRAFAPGRVNLIGDHTDYTGGLVLPFAIDRYTVVEGETGGDVVELRSSADPEPAVVPLDVGEPSAAAPGWARYVAGVICELRPHEGLVGTVSSCVPVGAGLSSSAALTLAVALALGFDGSPLELALVCQRAERRASGVPVGIMDQLASAAAEPGHALLIDCTTFAVSSVPLPAAVEVAVVHSGQSRALGQSAYSGRRAQCIAAEAVIGPLRSASLSDVGHIAEPVLRRRARHVVTENQRVRAFADAIVGGDFTMAGKLMGESHASLAADFDVSTPTLDALVQELAATPGVYGARLTGAGFGGCAVALCRPGTLTFPLPGAGRADRHGWLVRPGRRAGRS